MFGLEKKKKTTKQLEKEWGSEYKAMKEREYRDKLQTEIGGFKGRTKQPSLAERIASPKKIKSYAIKSAGLMKSFGAGMGEIGESFGQGKSYFGKSDFASGGMFSGMYGAAKKHKKSHRKSSGKTIVIKI
jgi:methanogenic corrinoid protein MtbC1